MTRNPSGENTEKTERNAEMVRLYTQEHMRFEDIGGLFGVTRERARQIVRRAGVGQDVTMANDAVRSEELRVSTVCEHCGRAMRRLPSLVKRFCSNRCGTQSRAYGSEFLLDELRRLALLLDQTPGTLDLVTPWPAHTVYYRRFGSIAHAQDLAGLIPNKLGGGKGRALLPDGFREEWSHLSETAA